MFISSIVLLQMNRTYVDTILGKRAPSVISPRRRRFPFSRQQASLVSRAHLGSLNFFVVFLKKIEFRISALLTDFQVVIN